MERIKAVCQIGENNVSNKSKLLKARKIRGHNFRKAMFARGSDWLCLVEDGEMDLGGFNRMVCPYSTERRDYFNVDGIYYPITEVEINIRHHLNDIKALFDEI